MNYCEKRPLPIAYSEKVSTFALPIRKGLAQNGFLHERPSGDFKRKIWKAKKSSYFCTPKPKEAWRYQLSRPSGNEEILF